MNGRTRKLSLRYKLLFLLVLFSVGPVLFFAYWVSDNFAETFEVVTIDGLRALAKAKAEAIDQFTADRKGQVERVASLIAPRVINVLRAETKVLEPPLGIADPSLLPQLKDAEQLRPDGTPKGEPRSSTSAAALNDRPGQISSSVAAAMMAPASRNEERLETARSALRQNLGLILWDQARFEEFLVMDSRGRVLASTFEGHESRSADTLEYFQRGIKATYVQPVFMSPITSRLTTVIATPIRDESSLVIGVLAARLNLEPFYRLINDYTGLGMSGETLVAKTIESKVMFMAPTRHDNQAAFRRSIAMNGEDGFAIREASRGQVGAGRVKDYRGEDVLAAWQHVPSLEWGLVVKIDHTEAMAPVQQARARAFVLAGVLLLLGVVASVLAARMLIRPLRELKEATDRISRGDFDVQINVHSSDEIGELSESFQRMIAAIKFFREPPMEHEEPMEDTASTRSEP